MYGMDKLQIKGGTRLKGEVTISGAKNSALPVMNATLLAPGKYTLKHIPSLMDVRTMRRLLEHMGTETDHTATRLTMDTTNIKTLEAPYELVKTMRASVLVLGPLVARYGSAKVSLPGGCNIGQRPVDLHLIGLSALGAKLRIERGYVVARARRP